jgi:hypothetical protein
VGLKAHTTARYDRQRDTDNENKKAGTHGLTISDLQGSLEVRGLRRVPAWAGSAAGRRGWQGDGYPLTVIEAQTIFQNAAQEPGKLRRFNAELAEHAEKSWAFALRALRLCVQRDR